jgi:hypothetical protein
LVYPEAWPTHGTWATLLTLLVVCGAGRVSLDQQLAGDFESNPGSRPDAYRGVCVRLTA